MHEVAVPCPPNAFEEPVSRPAVRRPLRLAPKHVDLRVRLDPNDPVVSGEVVHTVGVRSRCEGFVLDAVEIDVVGVWIDEAPVEFRALPSGLHVTPAAPLERGATANVRVAFSARPRVGLYFVPPRDGRPAQAWTQGAMEDHQHWFPCFDAPQHMVTSEVRATVPARYTALANGAQVGVEDGDDWRTFHWRHDTPHALYLITLVVDEVAEVRGQHGEVTLHHYVPPGREADAEVLFARVGEMLDFFAQATGRPYPYPRYGHAFLRDFMWGGMENTTLTSLTEAVLVAGEHRDEEDVERLIAHELAHQWFGDLIAPRGWPEIWLNESFATYYEQRCMLALNGPDDFHRRMAGERASYLGEARDRYARAVVTRNYAHPYVLFDRHAYEKGCLVLHMLRWQLEPEVFDAGVRLYVERAAGTAAETSDLRRACEDVSGEDLTDFFEHWVYGAAHAEAKVSWRYLSRVGLEVEIERTDALPAVVEVDIAVCGAEEATVRARLQPGRTVVTVPVSGPPSWVAVDPYERALLVLDESAESDAALRARMGAVSMPLKRRTAELLGGRASPSNRAALAGALRAEGVTVGAAAAAALGEHRCEQAREILGEFARDPVNPWRTRAAAARALGVGADASEISRFESLLAGVDRHRVRCGLIAGLGKIKDPRAAKVLRTQLPIESPKHCVRAATLTALAAQDKADHVADIEPYLADSHPRQVRQAAIAALGRLAKLESAAKSERRRLREVLERALQADNFFVRISAVAALKRLGHKKSKQPLERAHGAERFAFIRRRIREALGAIEG